MRGNAVGPSQGCGRWGRPSQLDDPSEADIAVVWEQERQSGGPQSRGPQSREASEWGCLRAGDRLVSPLRFSVCGRWSPSWTVLLPEKPQEPCSARLGPGSCGVSRCLAVAVGRRRDPGRQVLCVGPSALRPAFRGLAAAGPLRPPIVPPAPEPLGLVSFPVPPYPAGLLRTPTSRPWPRRPTGREGMRSSGWGDMS